MGEHQPLRSFLKWAGGKARTAELIARFAPRGYTTYHEPFCGSAAVFFALRPERAVLSDHNTDLVVCLQQVAVEPEAVMGELDTWPNTRDFFLQVRGWDPDRLTPTQRAARVIYINKTGFRGLWRVNRRGRVNTPYGEYNRPYYNRDTLLAASEALRNATIRQLCFRESLLKAEPGDWVYLDPPYVPDRAWGDFTRYTAGQFGPADQQELVELLGQLDRDGVQWLLTNSDTDVTRDLYADYQQWLMPTRRDVALNAAERASTDLVVANYAPSTLEGIHPVE